MIFNAASHGFPSAEILRQEVRVDMETGERQTREDARPDEMAPAGQRCARDGSLWLSLPPSMQVNQVNQVSNQGELVL